MCTPPPLMFQFALDPEEEARQVAQRVTADGRMRGLVLLPNNEWGQRVFRAFDTEIEDARRRDRRACGSTTRRRATIRSPSRSCC